MRERSGPEHTWMEATEARHERVASYPPVQRGEVRVSDLRGLDGGPARRRAWRQVAGLQPRPGSLAHGPYPDESLVEGLRSLERAFEISATAKIHPDEPGVPGKGLPVRRAGPGEDGSRQGSSGCRGCSKGGEILVGRPGRPVVRPRDANCCVDWTRIGRGGPCRRTGQVRAASLVKHTVQHPVGDGVHQRFQMGQTTGARQR